MIARMCGTTECYPLGSWAQESTLVGVVHEEGVVAGAAAPADDGPLAGVQPQRRNRRVQQHVAAQVRIHVLRTTPGASATLGHCCARVLVGDHASVERYICR